MILQKGFCRIDGQCYSNRTGILGMCQHCDPDKSVETWTASTGRGNLLYRDV